MIVSRKKNLIPERKIIIVNDDHVYGRSGRGRRTIR